MNIPVVSTISTPPCSEVIIQSFGETTYPGWYESLVFGIYRFVSIDVRGNNIYFANIQGTDSFIFKDMENDWVVRIVPL